MAPPRKKTNGVWVLTVSHQGSRRKLTIGKVSARQAESFARNVELLTEHVSFGGKTFPAPLQAWLSDLSAVHKAQLGQLGFFEYREPGMTAGKLFAMYERHFFQRLDRSDSTKRKVQSTIKNRLWKLPKTKLDILEPKQRTLISTAKPVWSEEAETLFRQFNAW